MPPKLRFTYLDIPGKGEAIRLALYVGGLEFEDRRVSYAQIAEMRQSGELPFGQVPMLEIDDKPFFQSEALLRWVGRQTSLYPDELQLACDEIVEALGDIRNAFAPHWYGVVLGRHPATGETLVSLNDDQRLDVQRTLNDVFLPIRFKYLEEVLKHRGGLYFCGDQMTICDLSYYVLAAGLKQGTFAEGIRSNVLGECPSLRALADRVADHPKVKEWNNMRRQVAA